MPREIPSDDLSRGSANRFTDLEDTPSTLTGDSLRRLRVNAAGSGLEFVDAPNPVFGNGFNALMVVDIGGVLTPSWIDIQEIIQMISGGSDQFAMLPTKAATVPTQGQSAAVTLADAQAQTESLSVTMPTQSATAEIV